MSSVMTSVDKGGFAMHSVIAVEFEKCLECFHFLCSGMQVNAVMWPETKEKFQQSRLQFLSWGRISGAANRSLDHALYKNILLRRQVVELLEAFNAALQHSLSLVQRAAIPLLSPAIFESTQSGYFDPRPRDLRRSEREPVTPEHIENSHNDIVNTINRLERLLPSLVDPFPKDSLWGEDYDNASLADVNLASRMFPKASPKLKQRLGKANWSRRLFLRNLRTRLREEKLAKSEGLITPGGTSYGAAAPLQSPRGKWAPSGLGPGRDHRAILGSITSRRTSTTGSLTADSGFWSRSDSYSGDTSTSVGEAEDASQGATLSVPSPPAALSKHTVFQCPYCFQDIIVGETSLDHEDRYLQHLLIASNGESHPENYSGSPSHSFSRLEVLTSDDWCRHVLADLEPYCCTIDDCGVGARTYHSVDLWLRHELDAHRLPRSWNCQLCGNQYRDPGLFTIHLDDIHSINAATATAFVDLCERYTDDSADLACSLCTLSCSSLDSYRTHVANHLEQLALASIEEDEKFEIYGTKSPVDPHLSTDYGRLEDFVFSQWKYVPGDVWKDQHSVRDRPKPAITQAPKFNTSQSYAPATARPLPPQRGPSYTFMSDARAQQALKSRPEGASLIPLEGQEEPRIGSLKRTNPPPQNMDFVGRFSELHELHRCLSLPGAICVLRGTSGLGKSSLAAEFTYRFGDEYGYIFWVQAENPMVCIDTFSQIATKATGGDFADLDEQRLVTLSREFLEVTTKKWLLVFDNVDQQLDLHRFLPSTMSRTTGSVLITTNRKDIGADSLLTDIGGSKVSISCIDLEPLTLEESRQLLLSARMEPGDTTNFKNHPEYVLAGDIAKRAQRLPLALSLIAGYLMVGQCPLSEFVNLWSERRKSIGTTPQGQSLEDSEQAMEAAWDLSLEEISPDSQKLLQILAFLDPDRVQKDLLVGPHEDPGLDFLRPSQSFKHTRMIAQLRKRRLIAMESKDGDETISIHRKLQAKILRDLGKDVALNRVFEQVLSLVRARFPVASPIQVPEPEKWTACKRYLPHVLSLQKLALNPTMDIKISVHLVKLFSDGGIDLWERGMTIEGLELLRCAERMLDQLVVDERLLRADIHVIVSLLLQDSGSIHFAECKDRIETALEARKQYQLTCDPTAYTKNDEILLYNAWADYACVLLQFNMYDEAAPIFNTCSEQYVRWGSPTTIPYEYAKYHHHIAFCHLYHKDVEKAVYHAKEGLQWVRQATGESAATYRWMFDLGCIEMQARTLPPGSESIVPLTTHTDVLKARLRLHGKFAFLTLESYYAVAACHSQMGYIADAERTLRTILELEKTRPGSCNAAALARTQFLLAQVLRLREEGSQASQGERSDTTGTQAGGTKGSLLGEEITVESTGADDGQDTTLPSEDRLAEAYDLEVMANKVLEEHKTLGTFSQLGIEKGEAKRFLDENGPMVLFDLMQPVFDGRFVGRDVLRFLWIVKGKDEQVVSLED